MSYQAEYIWIDGTQAFTVDALQNPRRRADGKQPGIWGFDGSSTNQAPGQNSDCVLRPVFSCPDPLRGGDNVLVLCEVELTDCHAARYQYPRRVRGRRRALYADQEPMFGIEQEYTFFQARPTRWGGLPHGYPAPQGPVLLR